MTLAEIWDICTKFMWDEAYVTGLDAFFQKRGVKTILDAAGGTGFPSIDLKKRGWDVWYADGSTEMVDLFKKKLRQSGISLPTYHANWSVLDKSIPEKFDAVLCRGNSLVYVDSWDEGKPSASVESDVKDALAQFYHALNGGGLMYVDIFDSSEFDRTSYPFIEEFGERKVDGKRVNMRWEVDHKPEIGLRVVKINLSIGRQVYEHTLYSYLLKHERLVELMKEVGFRDIQQINIPGEQNYAVYTGTK